jgi:hypothetical protein
MGYQNMKTLFFTFAILFSCSFASVFAQQKGYSLFKPVPKEEMRDMETDRPDVTETPITVDAGHFQYETSLLDYSKQYKGQNRINTHTINQLNFNVGITGSTAFQVMLDSYVSESERPIGSTVKTTSQGIGDVTFRIKQNLMGNDGGNFAIAMLPYLKVPTAKYKEDNRTEFGLSVPMRIQLPSEWTLGTQVEVDRLQEEGEHALHTDLLQSLSLSHDLFKNMEGLVETYYTYGIKKHEWNNFINAALQYEVSSNCKFDAGINYGVQHEATRSFFLGMAYRL